MRWQTAGKDLTYCILHDHSCHSSSPERYGEQFANSDRAGRILHRRRELNIHNSQSEGRIQTNMYFHSQVTLSTDVSTLHTRTLQAVERKVHTFPRNLGGLFHMASGDQYRPYYLTRNMGGNSDQLNLRGPGKLGRKSKA